MSPSDRQPRSLEIDAVFVGILEVLELRPALEVELARLADRQARSPSSSTTCTALNGLPTEPGCASHSSGPMIVPANPSVPP